MDRMTRLLPGCVPEPITVTENLAAEGVGADIRAKVVFIAGPDSHAAGEHEHAAGTELLASALRAQWQ